MPALLIRIVTVPNASTAVLMTAAPSETDEVFTTAFPPAKNQTFFRDGPRMQPCTMAKPLTISSTTFCAAAALKSFTTTLAPREANNSE